MGAPRTMMTTTTTTARGPRAQASRSRFHEGSMNDRVSAVPPVQFLGSEELALLERPVAVEQQDQEQQGQQGQQGGGAKKGGNLLGQVWEGVRGRLRLRREAAPAEDRKKAAAAAAAKKTPGVADRPSREDAMATYHSLIASGFFSSHAIQSTRHAAPSSRIVSQSQSLPLPQKPDYAARSPSPSPPLPLPRPQWPLTPTPKTTDKASTTPMLSPASASSRGTKRAAGDQVKDIEIHQDEQADDSAPKTKIRKIASRDAVFQRPRRLSARRIASTSALPPVIVQQHREPSKLTKRHPPLVLQPIAHHRPAACPPSSGSSSSSSSSSSLSSSTCSSLDAYWTGGGSKRNASENYYSVRAVGAGSMSSHALRPRSSALEPMSVVPDSNRGIPRVPAIPAKFTLAEDRENGLPWQGLNR